VGSLKHQEASVAGVADERLTRTRERMKISATIITFNEERNIARAIESLRCCDEIIVVDSGSTDRTTELAANLGARVIDTGWRGYAGQKNYASEQAENDWILSIDADEALSEALEAEIWQVKKNGPKHDGYTMPRLAKYLGRWIFHSGWYPDRKVRLFNRRHATWVGRYVHESVKVHGTIGHLEANLLHFTCDSLSEHLRTMDRYTTLAAQQVVAERRPVGWSNLLVDPAWTFIRTYVINRGFLDGMEGLAIAHMAALYNFLKYAKARFMNPER
jgi:glycosyltransferase involved in cell wall biosynthesis